MLLAAQQAWVSRHFITPDGIAYLDLSDAVLNGRPGELINGYWSPMYPALIGVARWMASPTALGAPYWEFALVHLVNLACFALSIAAFEWFLGALDEASAGWGQRPFASPLGKATAYVFFGSMSLIMISVKATTPDMLASAITFAAFACMLRLDSRPASRRTAIQFGAILALGALTKSFFFPLGVLMIATIGISTWRRGGRARALESFAVFAVATLPWCVALSISVGHATTGETGKLNYVWWVNRDQAPQSGMMPVAAAPAGALALDGLAVMPNARGTNPLWYDPVRWHPNARPRFSLAQQWKQLSEGLTFYLAVASPLLFAALVIGAAARFTDLRAAAIRSFVVVFPTLAALGAYALVYTAARYLAPFLVAGALMLAAAFPNDAPLRASRMALAFGLTLLLLDALSPMRSRVFITYGLALAILAWLAWRSRKPALRWILTIVTTAALLWVVAQLPSTIVRAAMLALGVILWIALSLNSRHWDAVASGITLRRAIAMGAVLAALLPGAIDGFYAVKDWKAGPPERIHPQWSVAQSAIRNGSPPGSKLALIGSPYNVGWARLARYQIVAVVPEPRVAAFWALREDDRKRIVQAFYEAGARRFISGVEP